jgi:PPOX class probable F420-dependent enzyme
LTSFPLPHLDPAVLAFLAERHLGILTTLRADGSPHSVPVGFAFESEALLVRIITQRTSVKARHAERGGRASVAQVDGARWLTLEGTARLAVAPAEVEQAVAAYAVRYQAPRASGSAGRAAIEISVDRVLGRV